MRYDGNIKNTHYTKKTIKFVLYTCSFYIYVDIVIICLSRVAHMLTYVVMLCSHINHMLDDTFTILHFHFAIKLYLFIQIAYYTHMGQAITIQKHANI